MIFENVELWNVDHLEPAVDGLGGFEMYRLPASLRETWEASRDSHKIPTGCEIRFVLQSGTAKIRLRCVGAPDGKGSAYSSLLTYYGSIQSGWQTMEYRFGPEETEMEILPPPKLEELRRLSRIAGHPFDPAVIRLILPNHRVALCGVEGDIRPPREEEVPVLRGLMYGSSITHGSMAICANQFLPCAIGRDLGCDMIGLGFAGSCRLEREMAEYVASRTDCDFFFTEMGINMLDLEEAEFERRVRQYLDIAANAHAGKYFVVTDLYYCSGDMMGNPKPNAFREIVSRAAAECGCANVHYVSGLDLLPSCAGLTADLVHPSVDGTATIRQGIVTYLRNLMHTGEAVE